MSYLILICIFTDVFLITLILLQRANAARSTIARRLKKISKKEADAEGELNTTLFIRIIRPFMNKISKAVIKVTPNQLVTAYEKRLEKAGYPLGLGVRDWISIQVILSVGLSVLIGVLNGGELAMAIVLGMGCGIIIPSFLISRRITKRQKEITNSLPDFIDLLTVCVEAGLGFDLALSRIIQKMPGPLADEFRIMLREVNIGRQRRDALRDMALRLDVPNLTSFIGAVVQADRLGVSIGNVLRIQSEQMRENRRQRAREKALKAPVKMIVPMVIFIFPTIFSVLLGPVVIKLLGTLFNL